MSKLQSKFFATVGEGSASNPDKFSAPQLRSAYRPDPQCLRGATEAAKAVIHRGLFARRPAWNQYKIAASMPETPASPSPAA